MRDFKIVGDISNTKSINGNGLFLYDFGNIYRTSLRELSRTFFPEDKDQQKLECDLVIGLQKDTVVQWIDEAEE